MKNHFKKLIYISIIGLIFVFLVDFYVKSQTDSLIFESINQVPKTEVGVVLEQE